MTAQSVRKNLSHLGSFEVPALGFLELNSISRGLFLTDVIIKKAPVKVIASQPISGGKHVLLFMGDVASVDESYRAALVESEGTILKNVLIPGVHPKLAPYLDSLWTLDAAWKAPGESVAIVESSSLAGAVISADAALKAANVSLCRMRLGQGIGGKAYFVLMGRQEEIEAAVDSAQNVLSDLESLVRTDIIPRPEESALNYF